jgi:hypothetical protein
MFYETVIIQRIVVNGAVWYRVAHIRVYGPEKRDDSLAKDHCLPMKTKRVLYWKKAL